MTVRQIADQLLRDLDASGGHLVAADGGADHIATAGLTPEAIIGDFDSLSQPEDWLGRTRLLRIEEQETTDFEKALYSTYAPVTIALGMTGGRFDHTLAALDGEGGLVEENGVAEAQADVAQGEKHREQTQTEKGGAHERTARIIAFEAAYVRPQARLAGTAMSISFGFGSFRLFMISTYCALVLPASRGLKRFSSPTEDTVHPL